MVFSCEKRSETHAILSYFPSEPVFERGYANKYYEHYYPKNKNRDASTRVVYSVLKKTGESEFIIESYNTAFWLTRKRFYHFDETAIYLDSSVNVTVTDTMVHQIEKGLSSKWDVNEIEDVHYEVNGNFLGGAFSFYGRQIGLRDSVIDGKPSKVFTNSYTQTIYREDTTENGWIEETFYVKDLGIYGSREELEEYIWEVELVEQMPLSKFKKLADHGEKRVAYIDPAEALDSGSGFEICGQEKSIADYYNSTPDGDYLHGKAALIDTIFSNLDEEQLMNQTGMLTFRFVVNCEGKAGRFIARGYDLNYQPFDFPEETVRHLYSLMLRLKEWQPVVIREEPQDAYFYFTFKLNNGKITDILP